MERIVTLKEEIGKFFFEKGLDFLTSVPQQRIQEIIQSSCTKGNSGKLTDFAEVFPVHRTTYGHFLSKGKVLLIFLVVIVAGIALVLMDEIRRQKYGLNLNEQFDQAVAELNRDIRSNMPYGTAVNRHGYAHFE